MKKKERIDFENVYSWFAGTMYSDRDCGKTVCGGYTCCYPVFDHGEPLYLVYLPGELEFLRGKLGDKFPAREIGKTGKFHCRGSSKCVYEYRPVDCRSFPLWPVVKNGTLTGFYDVRGSTCRVREIPDPFLEQIKKNWSRLVEIPAVRHWLEFEVPKCFGNFIPLDKEYRDE